MATATSRAIKRELKAAIKATTKRQAKTATKTLQAATLATIKSDKRVIAAREAYAKRESSSESLLLFIGDLVSIWASTKSYKTDKTTLAYLISEEKRIRLAGRQKRNVEITERDEKGVSASQFKGVLTLAGETNGKAMWQWIADVSGNWSYAKEITAKVRKHLKDKGKVSRANVVTIFATFMRKKKAAKKAAAKRMARGSNGGVTSASVVQLRDRANNALSSLNKTYGKPNGVAFNFYNAAVVALKKYIDAINVATKESARLAKIKAERKGKVAAVK